MSAALWESKTPDLPLAPRVEDPGEPGEPGEDKPSAPPKTDSDHAYIGLDAQLKQLSLKDFQQQPQLTAGRYPESLPYGQAPVSFSNGPMQNNYFDQNANGPSDFYSGDSFHSGVPPHHVQPSHRSAGYFHSAGGQFENFGRGRESARIFSAGRGGGGGRPSYRGRRSHRGSRSSAPPMIGGLDSVSMQVMQALPLEQQLALQMAAMAQQAPQVQLAQQAGRHGGRGGRGRGRREENPRSRNGGGRNPRNGRRRGQSGGERERESPLTQLSSTQSSDMRTLARTQVGSRLLQQNIIAGGQAALE